MTFSKEQISQAFTEVLIERVPDLSNIPDHTFSERFEKNMNRLIKKEAAHPWAVSHTLARNLIAAVLVIILLFAMCMSVGAIRNKIFNFFLQHFDEHDNVVFEVSETSEIKKKYAITAIPEDYSLVIEDNSPVGVFFVYQNKSGDYISLEQSFSTKKSFIVDNERSKYNHFEIDGKGVYLNRCDEEIALAWDQDGYSFLLSISDKMFSVEAAIEIFCSVEPVP